MASSYETFKDLDLSRDEVERIGTALKDKEFRKLLVEYVDEIRDPENRKIYEQEITQLEKERGVDVTFINPVAGYVIKTSVDGCQKGFINICANENIKKPTSTPSVQEGTRGLQWSLPHTLSPPREDMDNKGVRCKVFDVCFHPDTLHLAEKNKAFRSMVNNTACEAVELNFNVKLDSKNLKFPKLQYKGMPHASVIRKPSGEKPIERDPEEQQFYDKIYAQTSDYTSKPTIKSPKKFKKIDDTKSIYTTPNYIIKHRSHIEMEEFTEHKTSKLNSTIPKELVVEVNLPLLKSAADITLDVAEKTVQLISEKPAKYKLFLTLPYQVNQNIGNAKFDKDQKKLIITLPVKRGKNILICDVNRDDSGVDSDHNSPISSSPSEEDTYYNEEIKTKSADESRTKFLDYNLHYTLPEYTCHIFENIIAFTLNIKNVDENSLNRIIYDSDRALHVKFTSISSGFYPSHYAFFVKLKEHHINTENVTVEVWDNNVIVQIPFRPSDVMVNNYLIGIDENNIVEKYIEEPSIINYVMKEEALKDEEDVIHKEDCNSSDDCDKSIVEKPQSKAIDIANTYSESSGDELSCSYSPSKSRGILKRLSSLRTSVSRSVSESSIDDYICASSFENCHTSLDSVIPEDGEISTSLKKTVRFNDVVSRQLYRSNSSILGQKKKNQRKARNKKRALERRHSESEASEVEDRKEGDEKTSNITLNQNYTNDDDDDDEIKELQDIFDLDIN